MSSNTETDRFIDIPKGYRRLGQFPLDSGSVIKDSTIGGALAKAKKYAKDGNMNGTAYKGQVIAVLSENSEDYPELYTVNDNYDLVPVSGASSGTDLLSGTFTHLTISGATDSSFSIKMPAGMTINTVSVRITEPFVCSTGSIYFAFGPDDNLITVADSSDIAFDEEGDYVIKCTIPVTQTYYLKFYNSTGSSTGSGYIKLN